MSFTDLFCSEMQEVKRILRGKEDADAPECLLLQYPESSADINLAGGGTYTRTLSVRRRLKSITVSCGDNVLITLSNDNATFAWFFEEAGHEDLLNGKWIESLTIKVTNTGSDAARWALRMVFA